MFRTEKNLFIKIHPTAMKSGKDGGPMISGKPATSASFTISCIQLYQNQ